VININYPFNLVNPKDNDLCNILIFLLSLLIIMEINQNQIKYSIVYYYIFS